MTTMSDIRRQYPQYSDMSDQQLAQSLHAKYYSDVPFDQFSRQIGYAQPQQQPQRMTAGDWLRATNPLTLPEFAAERLSRMPTRSGSIMAGLRDGLSLGGGDELSGVQAAGVSMLTGASPQQAAQAYTQAQDQERQNLRDQMLARPVSTGAGQLAGSLVPGFGTAGIVTRGAGTAGRIGLAAGTGAGIGAVSGALSGETDEERLRGAAVGGGLGALLGGGGQAVLGELVPTAWNAGRRWLSGVTGLPTQPGRMGIAETARQDLMATAQQNMNLGVRNEADLVARMQQAAAADPTLTVAEVMGQSGQGRLAALARAPGQTGQRVEDFFTNRARDQADEVTAAVLGRAPASGDALEQTLQQQWREQGPALYEPVLSQTLSPQSRQAAAALEQSPLFQHRAVQTAWQRSGAMIADDVALGRIPPGAESSLAHRLHYTKVALDDMIADPTKLEPGIRNMNNASIAAAREQFLGRIERIIPGYDAARAQMADIGAARRAVQQGRQAFTRQNFQTPAALQRHIAQLPEAERPYFIAGVEDALSNMIASAGRDGRRNIANSLLSDQTQARLRAVYGPEANGMLNRLRQISQKFDFGQRVRPSQGSVTSNILLQLSPGIAGAGLGAANAQDDPVMGALTGGALGFGATAIGRQALRNAVVGRLNSVAEQQRNLLGRIYLTPASRFQRASRGLLSRAQREAQRRAERIKLDRTRAAYVGGLGAIGLYEPERN